MEAPPKTSNVNLTKKPTSLEYEVFICYFGQRGSGHCPTPIDTFHSRRLPPSGSQTPTRILGGTPCSGGPLPLIFCIRAFGTYLLGGIYLAEKIISYGIFQNKGVMVFYM